jgi:adenylate cyclase
MLSATRKRIFAISGLTIALLISGVISVSYVLFSDSFTLLQSFENKTLDLRFRIRGPIAPSGNIVIVTIDDFSIDALGKWPWPRSYHGYLLDALTLAGAKAVAFDLILSEPELSRELEQIWMLKQRYRTLSIARATAEGREFQGMFDEAIRALDTDRVFADSLARNRNGIMAMVFQAFSEIEGKPVEFEYGLVGEEALPPGDEEVVPGDMPPPELMEDLDARAPALSTEGDEWLSQVLHEAALAPDEVRALALDQTLTDKERALFRVPVARDILLPITAFVRNSRRLGYVNLFVDMESVPRWDTMLIDYGGGYYPSFALQCYKEFMGIDDADVEIRPGRGLRVGGAFFPMDEFGRVLMNYYGPKNSFPYVSFSDVLEGLVPASVFKDKIVLVGTAATGLGDLWPTPFSKDMPGVEKHALVLDNMIQGNFLVRGRTALWVDVALIMLVGFLLGVGIPRLSPYGGLLYAFLMLALVCVVDYALFAYSGMWVNLVYPVLAILAVSAGVITFKLFTEEREKRVVKKAFKQYLNPTLVDELVKHPESLKLGGEQKELTVLFSDIRGFTSISERMAPEQLVSFLNSYLSAMTDIVMEHNGLVDKFIGDAIMAVYGAPIYLPDHPQLACRTAVRMLDALDLMQAEWTAQGYPPVRIGIGVNTGMMVAGNMGSKDRFDYTVMGDSVNLASRLEGLNKTYGTSIIVSEFTAAKIEGFVLRDLDLVRVAGREEPIGILSILGIRGELSYNEEELRRYHEALALYRKRDWEEALRIFRSLHEIFEDPLYRLYADRCSTFSETPPPASWDGVFTFSLK